MSGDYTKNTQGFRAKLDFAAEDGKKLLVLRPLP